MPLTVPHPPAPGVFSSHPARSTAIHPRVAGVTRLLHLWHLASLDAPTVAAVWSLAFAQVAGVTLPAWVPILLMLTVWAVYIADRVLDAHSALRRSHAHTLRERHYFHWRHRRLLVPIALAAACAAAWMIFQWMPVVARQRNSLLAAAALAYFTRVHGSRERSPFLSKELLVGLIFALGCAMPTWVRAPFLSIVCPVAFFALLAWLNCHAIDRWERASADPTRWPIAATAAVIAAIGLSLAAVLASAQPRAAALLIAGAASALLLALLDRLRNRLDPLTLRATADLVLLTPALLTPLAWLTR